MRPARLAYDAGMSIDTLLLLLSLAVAQAAAEAEAAETEAANAAQTVAAEAAGAAEGVEGVESVVTTLDGERIEGRVTAIDAASLQIDDRTVPLDALLVWQRPDIAPRSTADADLVARLADGSVWTAADIARRGTETTLRLSDAGTADASDASDAGDAADSLPLPAGTVRSVRLSLLDEETAEAWQDLLDGDRRDDLLVVRKGDKLDFVACTIGDIDDQTVQVLVGSRDLKLPRSKAFGLIFSETRSFAKPLASVSLMDGSQVAAAGLTLRDGRFEIAPLVGPPLSRAADAVASIDFAQGRMVRLATITPRVSYEQQERIFSGTRPFRVGQNVLGQPPQLASRTDPQAIWMHSGTTARFALPRGATRLQATAGVDEIEGADIPGRPIRVSVQGDGQPLWEQTVQPYEPVELDVTLDGVRQLTIEVDGDTPDGIREHLVLLGARLVTE